MSNLTRVNIYTPEFLFFEMQQFRQSYVCWFSGPYHTHKVKFSNNLWLELWRDKLRLKERFVEVGSSFYETTSNKNRRQIHKNMTLLTIYIRHWTLGALVGFQNALRLRGVGYRFDISPLKITIQVGHSHVVFRQFPVQKLLQQSLINKKATFFKIKSWNLTFLHTFLSSIRNLRPPDVYKGKGIRYHKEFIFRKEGKKKKKLANFMARLNQLIRKKRKARKDKDKRPDLQNCPQKKATCLKVFVMTPRKPNSALRKVAWVLLSNYHRVHAYIPGMGGHTLQKHSVVLIRGGRVKDLPGMKYTIIRGKFDLKRIYDRRSAPSKYGAKKIYNRVDHRYRKYCYW